MESFLQDIRYGLRMMLKSKGFTLVAVLSLALGIGANTTIFTLVNAIFFQPLHMQRPDELVAIFGSDEKNTLITYTPVSFLNFEDYRNQNSVFTGMALTGPAGMSLTHGDQPEQLPGLMVTGNYFELLGVKMERGRSFLPEEDQTAGTHPVIVIGYDLWQRRFGGEAQILGSQIKFNGGDFTVVGIAPKNFRGANAIGQVDFYVPFSMYERVANEPVRTWFRERTPMLRRFLSFNAFARLKPDVTLEQADVELKAIAKRLERDYPRENEKRGLQLVPISQAVINPNQRDNFVMAGWLLMTIVGLVLLIACANVANLLLVRANLRRREIAIRLAMGASRMRLVQQLMTESIMLSLMGGGIGLLIAIWGRDLLWAFRPPQFPQNGIDLSLNARVLIFTLVVSVLTGIFFGLTPALQSSRPDLVNELKKSTQKLGLANFRFSVRNLLVVFQVALSVVSLVGAGLFVRSLWKIQQVDPGFNTEQVLKMSFNVGSQGYNEARGREHYRQVLEKVKAIPGVKSVSIAVSPPLQVTVQRTLFIEGQQQQDGPILVPVNGVDADYFQTLGIPIVKGREFNAQDLPDTPKKAIVNEAMADKYWPDQDVVGKRFKFFDEPNFFEIVGVAKNTNYITVGETPRPFFYICRNQNYVPFATLYVRTEGDPKLLLGVVQHEVQSLDKNIPILFPNTLSEVLGAALWNWRIAASLLGIFAALALVLSIIGIYGVLAFSVAQRTHEIGIRMALGARPTDIFKLVLGQGMSLVVIGIIIGLTSGYFLMRMVTSLLFQVNAADPLTFSLISLLLFVIAMLACYLPARRASRVDPLVAVRYE